MTKYHFIIDVLILYFVIIACMLFSGCTTTKYVPVENVVDHYVTKTDTLISHDTLTCEKNTIIREVDSTALAEYGITIASKERAWLIDRQTLQNKISELQKIHSDTVHDSIYITQVESIPVETELSTLQKWELRLFFPFLIVLIGLLLYLIIRKILLKFI